MKNTKKAKQNEYAAFDDKTVRLANISLAVNDIERCKNKVQNDLMKKILQIEKETSKLESESSKRSRAENMKNDAPQRTMIRKDFFCDARKTALCNLTTAFDDVIRHKDIAQKDLLKKIILVNKDITGVIFSPEDQKETKNSAKKASSKIIKKNKKLTTNKVICPQK